MKNKLGNVLYADYCIEFEVYFEGKKVKVLKTSETGFEYEDDIFTEEDQDERFSEWLNDSVAVSLKVYDVNDDTDQETKAFLGKIKRLKEEIEWLENLSRMP